MDRLSCHATLAWIHPRDRPELPCDVEIGGEDSWPAAATALASLSGQLEEAQDEADLLAAVEHGISLLIGGVISLADVQREVFQVVADVLTWGAGVEGR